MSRRSILISISSFLLSKNQFSKSWKFSSFHRKFSSSISDQKLVLFKQNEKGIAELTLNDPKKRNALSFQMIKELKQELEKVATNKEIKVLILSAAGKVFSSGHDLKEIQANANNAEFIKTLFETCSNLCSFFKDMPQPVIGEVHGLATAAGCQLVASLDLVVASTESQFATPGVKVGLFCSTPGVAVVRHINSQKKALEMLFTGEPISAQEAVQYGLINKAVPLDKLHQETMTLAEKIAQYPLSVMSLGKRNYYKQVALPIDQAYSSMEKVMAQNIQMSECREGIAAFVEKRHPKWNKE